jgi:hypothetical protein
MLLLVGPGDLVDVPEVSSDRLQASAREWHKLQLAALGFVGLCGVLKGDSGEDDPVWLQTVSGVLALAALVTAVAAVLLVAAVAWPIAGAPTPDAAARRVRSGIGLTFVAIAVTALSTMSSWWPADPADRAGVTVTTASWSACGTLLDGADGWVELDVDGERVRALLDEVVSLDPVGGC